jgi:hypothetical protein
MPVFFEVEAVGILPIETKKLRDGGDMFKEFQVPSALKQTVALFTAALIAMGPIATPAVAASGTTATPIQHLVVMFQREYFVRSLLRYLPGRNQSQGRAEIYSGRRHTQRKWTNQRAADFQSQLESRQWHRRIKSLSP